MIEHIFAYRIISRDTRNSRESNILKMRKRVRRSKKIHKLEIHQSSIIIQQKKVKKMCDDSENEASLSQISGRCPIQSLCNFSYFTCFCFGKALYFLILCNKIKKSVCRTTECSAYVHYRSFTQNHSYPRSSKHDTEIPLLKKVMKTASY